MVDKVDELFSNLNTIELRTEYLDEVSLTLVEEPAGEETLAKEPSTKVIVEASAAETSEPQPPTS